MLTFGPQYQIAKIPYTMTALVLIVFVLLFVFVAIGSKKQKENESRVQDSLNALGIAPESILFKCNYLSGHPDIDESKEGLSIVKTNDRVSLYFIPYGLITGDPVEHGSIQSDAINNIVVEDKTTIEKRVTVGRLLLTGVFALAWKKKKVDEAAYLVIEWKDGRFDHETVFEFAGKGSMQEANAARNKLIKAVK